MALPTSEYMLLKGKVSLYERNPTTGVTGKGLYVGNCPELKIALTTEKIEHYESMNITGINQLDRNIIKRVKVDVNITLESMTRENVALLLWGSAQPIDADTNTIDTLPTGVVVDRPYLLSTPNITNVDSVVDSAGSPVTVTTTKYEVDETFGVITFNNISGYTQPFKVQYDNGASVALPFFKTEQPVRFLRFDGGNKANPGSTQRYIVDIYNLPLEPVSEFNLITDELSKLELKGSAVVDANREDDDLLGQFGRIIYLN